jgi:butanol dehydrogenase
MNGNFEFYNPTRIYFGKGSIQNLEKALAPYGKRILLAYGTGSIKRNGIYDQMISILKKCGKEIYELGGIRSNPSYSSVLEGKRIIEENHIDFILAVGGGSVIDCSKGMAASVHEDDPWEKYYVRQEPLTHDVTPIGTILTMVGTGSEMNSGSVITHEEKKLKLGRVFGEHNYPVFSILDPTYTLTVPYEQMVSGIFDMFSHLMEQYFSDDGDNTSDYLLEGLMRAVISHGRKAAMNPSDEEARSNLMWEATLALNTLVELGKKQDWNVHGIEHQLGAYTHCPHGLGLAVISYPYYKYVSRFGKKQFEKYAINVFGISKEGKTQDEIIHEGIDAMESFIKELKIPTTLKELGATKEMLKEIADSAYSNGLGGGFHPLSAEETLRILEECYE